MQEYEVTIQLSEVYTIKVKSTSKEDAEQQAYDKLDAASQYKRESYHYDSASETISVYEI